MMTLSPQQKAVVEAVAANNADIQVTARAGCGKTTTILAACEVAKGRVAFFAFNKSIATELASKAPAHVKVQTLHALGFAAIRGAFRGVNVDADKTYNLILPLLKGDESEIIGHVKKLVSLVKNNMIEPTEENLSDLALEYDVPVNGNAARVFELVAAVMETSIPAPGTGPVVIDFDDMIFLPPFLNLPVPSFDWTFVDEAQDMNAAQMRLVHMVASRGRVCYVGDPAQAIYGFRGADSAAMNTMAATLRDDGRTVIELPLTLTRRCPKAIVKAANAYVPDFEAFPEAPEGEISSKTEVEAVPGDMVLCRMNAPLVPIAYRLLRAGVPVKIQGKDIGAGLLAVIRKLKPYSIDDLISKVETYRLKEFNTLSKKYANKPSKLETAIATLNDKTETLVSLAAEANTITDLEANINRLFGEVANATGVVLLSTIHKAKGLEAPKVWLLDVATRPGPQENNIRYVAITRAKAALVIVPVREK